MVEQACEAERLRWQAGESATWRELWYDVRGRWQEVVLARLLEQDAGRDLRTMLGQEMQKKVRARYVFRSVGEGATEFDERCQRVFDRTFLERAKRQYAAAMRPQRGAWARDYLPLAKEEAGEDPAVQSARLAFRAVFQAELAARIMVVEARIQLDQEKERITRESGVEEKRAAWAGVCEKVRLLRKEGYEVQSEIGELMGSQFSNAVDELRTCQQLTEDQASVLLRDLQQAEASRKGQEQVLIPPLKDALSARKRELAAARRASKGPRIQLDAAFQRATERCLRRRVRYRSATDGREM